MTDFIRKNFFASFSVFPSVGRFTAKTQTYSLVNVSAKDSKLDALLCKFPAMPTKSYCFFQKTIILFLKSLALMGGKILLWWGSPQKIGRTAGSAP
jgi:hypothetical protein